MSTALHNVSNTSIVRIRTPNYYTQAEIEEMLDRLAEQAKKFLPTGTEPTWRLNFVMNRSVYVGYCFAAVEPVAFFHLLLGNNADGSLRERAEIEDYGGGPPPIPIGLKWPLEQTELPKELAEAMAKWRGDWDSDELTVKYVKEAPLLDIPFGLTIEVAQLSDQYFTPEVSGFILTIKEAPVWLSEEDLRPIFGHYSHAGPEYPKIWTLPPRAGSQGRTIFLAYRPGSYDALFALTMLRRFRLIKEGRTHEFTVGQANSKVTVPNKERPEKSGAHNDRREGGQGNHGGNQGGHSGNDSNDRGRSNHNQNGQGSKNNSNKNKVSDDGWSTTAKKR